MSFRAAERNTSNCKVVGIDQEKVSHMNLEENMEETCPGITVIFLYRLQTNKMGSIRRLLNTNRIIFILSKLHLRNLMQKTTILLNLSCWILREIN